jgi:ABC-type transporter Mla subunit MlaD
MKASTRNNTLAGGFVVVSMLLAVWGSFQLSQEGPKGAKKPVVFRFTIQEGAPGIKPGSRVLLGGQEIGIVTAVGFTTGEGSAAPGTTPSDIDVLASVLRDIPLYQNAGVYLERPLLGSLSTIGITSVGTPEGGAESAKKDLPARSALNADAMVLRGGTAPPAVLQQAGLGPEQINKIQKIVDDVSSAAERVSQMVGTNQPKVDSIVASAESTARSISEQMPEWTGRVDSVLEKADKASDQFEPFLERSRDVVARAQESADRIDAAIQRYEPKIDSILTNADQAVAAFNTQTLARMDRAVAEAEDFFTKAQRSVVRIDEFLATDLPGVRKSLANMRLASDQIKLLAQDVRAQPWRVLYEPTTKELESQVFYDATRAYAIAVSDLRAAGEALNAAMGVAAANSAVTAASGAGPALNLELVHAMSKELAESFERYRTAERELLRKLGPAAPTSDTPASPAAPTR